MTIGNRILVAAFMGLIAGIALGLVIVLLAVVHDRFGALALVILLGVAGMTGFAVVEALTE